MNTNLKKLLLVSVSVLTIFALYAFAAQKTGQQADSAQKNEIKGDIAAATQAWPMIEAGALVIDVRSKKEFDGGHLEGSLNIVHTEISALTAAIGDQKDRNVVLYCRSGNRAGKSLKKLEELGYSAIFNASGLDALLATKP